MIKTCGDCIHADVCKEVNGGWFSPKNPAYCKLFKKKDVPSKWISVENGLPEESGTYITAAFDGHTSRVTFVKWQKRNRHWELTGARSYWKITHWMPLPELPENNE